MEESPKRPAAEDRPDFALAAVGFFFPYVGLIVWWVLRRDKPLRAGSAYKGAVWGTILHALAVLAVAGVALWLLRPMLDQLQNSMSI